MNPVNETWRDVEIVRFQAFHDFWSESNRLVVVGF